MIFGVTTFQAYQNTKYSDATKDCSDVYGCDKEKCWAGCASILNMWCWTKKTRGENQTTTTVPCETDDICRPCWKCASACFWV